MSQDTEKANAEKGKTGKLRIEAKIPDSVIIVNQPAVRTFSTGGGHLPGDTLVEGDQKNCDQEVAGLSTGESEFGGQAAPGDAGSWYSPVHGQSAIRDSGSLAEHAPREGAGKPPCARADQEHRRLQSGEDAGSRATS